VILTRIFEILTKEIIIGEDVEDKFDDSLDNGEAKVNHRTNAEKKCNNHTPLFL
jgi:hypothetical protein